jgi:hypothetical protein
LSTQLVKIFLGARVTSTTDVLEPCAALQLRTQFATVFHLPASLKAFQLSPSTHIGFEPEASQEMALIVLSQSDRLSAEESQAETESTRRFLFLSGCSLSIIQLMWHDGGK